MRWIEEPTMIITEDAMEVGEKAPGNSGNKLSKVIKDLINKHEDLKL